MNNETLINQFLEFCKANGIGKYRIMKYEYTLPKISLMLNKPFNKANKNDMIKLMVKIEDLKTKKNEPIKEWTKHDYRVVIKRFYKWLNKDEDYPDTVRWIKTTMKNGNKKLPEDMLTEDEIQILIDSATNPRDKAFISVLYESGCRIAEILNMKIKHISFDEYSPTIVVSGKTGSRRIRLIDKNNYLKIWLDNHFFKDDPDAYVWVSIATNRKNNPLEYHSAVKLLRNLAKKSKIKKAVNPHNFRHSRATYLASRLTEAQMKQMFGWTQSSNMASIYVHLSGRDIDKSILQIGGLLDKQITSDRTTEDALKQLVDKDPDVLKYLANKLKQHGLMESIS